MHSNRRCVHAVFCLSRIRVFAAQMPQVPLYTKSLPRQAGEGFFRKGDFCAILALMGRCPGLYSFAPSGHHGSPHSASRTAPKLPCTIKHLRSEIPRDAAVRSEIPIRKKNGQVRVPPITVAPTPRDARKIREVAKAISGVLESASAQNQGQGRNQ